MNKQYYTVEEISTILNLHVKTIQRYIREGKLNATKIGKSWRVSGHDLSLFTETNTTDIENSNENIEIEDSKASAVIDIKFKNTQQANNLINMMSAIMNVKPVEYGYSSMHSQIIDSEKIVRFSLWGNIQFMSAIFSSLDIYSNQNKEE